MTQCGLDDDEVRVLEMFGFRMIANKKDIRADMPKLHEAFDRLIHKGMIESIFVLTDDGEDAVRRACGEQVQATQNPRASTQNPDT